MRPVREWMKWASLSSNRSPNNGRPAAETDPSRADDPKLALVVTNFRCVVRGSSTLTGGLQQATGAIGMGGKRSAGLLPLLVPIALSAAPAAAEQQTPPEAAAASPAQVVIVLDGSRNMWGKIGGQGKVPLARTAIGAALADYKDKVAFGVIAFGHGSASGCADVEVRAKPGELTTANRNKVLLNFNPRTSRPLASALTEAAKLGQANRGIDAILITDGSDNCKMDSC